MCAIARKKSFGIAPSSLDFFTIFLSVYYLFHLVIITKVNNRDFLIKIEVTKLKFFYLFYSDVLFDLKVKYSMIWTYILLNLLIMLMD